MRSLPAVALLALAACGGAGAPPPASQAPGPWAEQGELRIPAPADGAHGRGGTEPLVTLVVFTDFECPYCREAVPALDRVVAAHAGDVRLHVRHFPLPFHAHAQLAAEAAEEARAQGGDEAFFRYHDLAMRGAPGLRIGTPAFLIGERLLLGAQPFEAFERAVREVLGAATGPADDPGRPRGPTLTRSEEHRKVPRPFSRRGLDVSNRRSRGDLGEAFGSGCSGVPLSRGWLCVSHPAARYRPVAGWLAAVPTVVRPARVTSKE